MTTLTEDYKPSLNRLKERLTSNRFLRWWMAELSELVPAWLRSPKISTEQFAAISLEQVNAQWTPPSGDPRPLALALPVNRVLRKVVRLPLATEENLRQVLEFQIEQHTPFNSSQVYFGISVVERDFERGTLSADLIVTPRAVVDQAIKTMADRGGVVSAVFSADMLANGHLVNLLPAAVGRAPSPWFQGANLWLLALVGVMGLAAMILPLAVKREAVIQLHPWVDKGKNAAEAVDSVRRELEMRIDQHNFLLEKRQMFPTVIQTLEELTRVLPDDTWVLTLDIKGKELQIQGETASSVKLIGLFEQSSMFKDASFRSPLTKGQSSGTERYQLALQVRPVSPTASVGERVLPVSAPASAAVLLPNPVASSPATKASDGVYAAISGVKGP